MEERYRSVLYTLAISNNMISAQRAAGICTAVSVAHIQVSEAMAYSLHCAFSIVALSFLIYLFSILKANMMSAKNSSKVGFWISFVLYLFLGFFLWSLPRLGSLGLSLVSAYQITSPLNSST